MKAVRWKALLNPLFPIDRNGLGSILLVRPVVDPIEPMTRKRL
jgi:hypothetical protein